jgi:hypothetical protein
MHGDADTRKRMMNVLLPPEKRLAGPKGSAL